MDHKLNKIKLVHSILVFKVKEHRSCCIVEGPRLSHVEENITLPPSCFEKAKVTSDTSIAGNIEFRVMDDLILKAGEAFP